MDQESLSHDSAMISTNRRMRTRMSGGVGAGGEKPPATRFFFLISKFKDRKILLGSPPVGISAGFLGWFLGLLPKSTQSLEPALSA